MPALRVPISGGGRFKSDVLSFSHHTVRLELVRRTEPRKCPKCKGRGVLDLGHGQWVPCDYVERKKTNPVYCDKGKVGGDKIVFHKKEIEDMKKLALKLAELLHPNQVLMFLVAHFPKYRRWIEKELIEWNGKDVVINV